MRFPLPALPAFFLCFVLHAPAFAASGGKAAAGDVHAQLQALFDAEWEWQAREFPEFSTFRGDNRYNDRLTDQSAAAVQARRAHRQEHDARLRRIDRSRLTDEEKISYDVARFRLDEALRFDAIFRDLPFENGFAPVTQMYGPHFLLPGVAKATPFRNVADYDAYLKRLAAVPVLLQQTRARMESGMASKWMPPAVAIQRAPSQIDAHLAADVTQTPLYRPFAKFPADMPEADRQRIAQAGRAVLEEKVVPAFRELKDFYQASIATSTTTSMSAKEIHELGLGEVTRINAEMDEVMHRAGFTGTRAAFLEFLHNSPQFHYTTAEDMLAGYRDIAKRADAELPRLFAELPRMPYGIRAMEAYEGDNAEHYSGGSADGSRAGYFEANVNNLQRRSKWEMESLLLHEAVPGHHLQVSRAQEIKSLPAFRRYSFNPAYGEGWALYSESLGDEMGFYKDPYSKFGQLSAEMHRACRLVVDTGLHAFGWTRERAIRYLTDNAGLDESFAIAEVDRYLVWPGQALAYKVGELRIKAMRARAKAALGERFDLRRFHNAVLDEGPLPLDVLDRVMDRWIEAEKKRSR
jgi:uncharacterized protein (DUF885 family)